MYACVLAEMLSWFGLLMIDDVGKWKIRKVYTCFALDHALTAFGSYKSLRMR